jgi:nucleotide sugar dehydrogenase
MGLPLAALLAANGAHVTVCDPSDLVVAAVQAGQSPYDEPDLDRYIAAGVATGVLQATTDTTESVASSDVVVVIVPAHLDHQKDIDYSILLSASFDIGRGLKRGTLVSYETTVAVGGTRSVLVPQLEAHSGLEAGKDFFVAHSPERVKANLVFSRLLETPKIVGGFDADSAERAATFYRTYLTAPVIDLGSLEAAELSKLAGMVYRDVNIGLANELAEYAENVGVDFETVRAAANTDGESNLLAPGIGVGGHCTPVYPHFLMQDARRRGSPSLLVEHARTTNAAQPNRHALRLEAALGSLVGTRVHILGVAFRPEVKVAQFNTAEPLRDSLVSMGASVTAEDEHLSKTELDSLGFRASTIADASPIAVVLNTAHPSYRLPDFSAWQKAGVRVVLDGRRIWDPSQFELAGISYLGTGFGRL